MYVPPSGFSFEPFDPLEPMGASPARLAPPGSVSSPLRSTADGVDFGTMRANDPRGAMRASDLQGPVRPPPSPAWDSPRPWPPATDRLPGTTALASLVAEGPACVAAGLLPLGGLGLGMFGQLLEEGRQVPRRPRGPWDARATAHGWSIPRNPQRTPVRPRHAFEIEEGTDDLGPLQIVPGTVGRLRAVRLQWPEGLAEPAFSAQCTLFRDVLERFPSDVKVHIVAEGRLAAEVLGRLLVQWSVPRPERVEVHCMSLSSTPAVLYSPMTMWARDGALLARTRDARDVLLLPKSFRGDGQVDARHNRVIVQGSGAAPAFLAGILSQVTVRRTRLSFEGGDVIASQRAVLVGADTVERNVQLLRASREKVLELFEGTLGRPAVMVEPQGDFHLDLGVTLLDDDTVAVADAELGVQLARGLRRPECDQMIEATRAASLAERYDRVAQNLSARGYRVVRLPNLRGVGLVTPYLTYNNVLMERYAAGDGQEVRRVYMPVYELPSMDEFAQGIYQRHGFEVVAMPSARSCTRLWGAVRCAVGDLQIA